MLVSSWASRLVCLRFQLIIKITLNCERPLIESKERKETAGRKASGRPFSPRPARGCSALCRPYPKLAKKPPSSGKIQLDRPGDIVSDGSDDEAVPCDEDTAFQRSRGFLSAEPSWGSCFVIADHQRAFTLRPNLSDQRYPSPQISSSNKRVKRRGNLTGTKRSLKHNFLCTQKLWIQFHRKLNFNSMYNDTQLHRTF